MLSSNNSPWNDNQKRKNSSQEEQIQRGVDKQGDAIYDYERVPASWRGFDDQSGILSCDDTAESGANHARQSSKP